ncbi:MAG: hypothetical protein ACI3YK_04750 [Eubacteriales bacterium]
MTEKTMVYEAPLAQIELMDSDIVLTSSPSVDLRTGPGDEKPWSEG